MSHFTVMVVGENPEEQLAPFSENIELEPYVEYTKEQLILKGKKEIEDYRNGCYAEYLSDPEKYKNKCTNPHHLNYVSKEFPEKLNWTDEQIYQDQLADYEEDQITSEGGVLSTYNPKSKWDWYKLGGRWTGSLKLKDGRSGITGTPGLMTNNANKGFCDQARLQDIDFDNMGNDFSVFAVLKDGKWYERGEMGWWGCVFNEKEKDKWQEEFNKLLKSLPENTLISIYDCHI